MESAPKNQLFRLFTYQSNMLKVELLSFLTPLEYLVLMLLSKPSKAFIDRFYKDNWQEQAKLISERHLISYDELIASYNNF